MSAARDRDAAAFVTVRGLQASNTLLAKADAVVEESRWPGGPQMGGAEADCCNRGQGEIGGAVLHPGRTRPWARMHGMHARRGRRRR